MKFIKLKKIFGIGTFFIVFCFCIFFNLLFASYGSLGTEIFTDENGNRVMYNTISLYPEFSIWKLSIGLDVRLYIDQEGNVRKNNWDTWDDILDKIWYIRYGQKGESIFINFGGIDSATLGHGTIFNRYSNMIRYPEVKKVGLLFDVNFDSWGMETLISNLDRKEVFGARFYYRPLIKSGLFLIDKLTFGISGGMDTNPDDKDETKKDEISVVAVDVEIPILKTKTISTTWFTDIAQMKLGDVYTNYHNYVKGTVTLNAKSSDNGNGYITGFLGKLLFLDYKLVYKNLDNNFIYAFFDRFYDVERIYKANIISDTSKPRQEGYIAELSYSYKNLFSIFVSYDDMKSDDYGIYPWLHAEIAISKELLINKFSFSASIDKKDFKNWKTFKKLDTPNTLLNLELGYAIAPNAMIYMIKQENFDEYNNHITKTKFELRIMF
ncbi:MAG: hypothetical protein LBF97_06670 [Elusimicrobiota bacterium]|nr:hypothetical protein [Elusimicrobiota bacterium]